MPIEEQLGLHAGQQHRVREDIDERADHGEAGFRRHLIRRQPLAEITAGCEPRTRQRIELARVERAHAGLRDGRRLQCDEVVTAFGLHREMLPTVVHENLDTGILEDVAVDVAEIVRVFEDLA